MAFPRTKSLCFFFFLTVLLSFSTISNARRFGVGGSGAWVPNPPEDYGSWAGKSRFLVHDTLYFTYAKGADSVLEVSKADYDGCNTKNPIKKVDDGNSEISLDRSGPFYFISGNEDNCKKGQKLAVVVLSVRTSTPPPQAATPGNSPPGSMPPKSSSSPVSPATSPPAPPKSSSPVSPSSAPVTSPPGSMSPQSSAPVTSPPGSMSPKSSSPGSPMTSPPSPPSSAPGSSPSGSMAPGSSSAVSPSLAPGESPSSISSSPSGMGPSGYAPSGSAMGPSGSEMGPSGDGPSSSGDINAPAGAPDGKKSSANGMTVMSVTTVLSLVVTIFMSA
ncbi:hypothetical protein Bca4012_022967 [Brassica carinata]|uniref:Phytocyanin domain-containing protein n=1 Tax=Brassica carinata TaxID=52824 RepID=A0A8X7NZB2_BRACI|nr:hypothetical protein Bca52824_096438 [Brassica carinata]